MLRVSLLGEFSIGCDNASVTNIDSPRLQSLLAFLILHRDAQTRYLKARHQVVFASFTPFIMERFGNSTQSDCRLSPDIRRRLAAGPPRPLLHRTSCWGILLRA